MNHHEINAALYDKMSAELDEYRKWLTQQPVDEILKNCYKYAVLQDILMGFEYNDLSHRQAGALLQSPTPLEDVFAEFEKHETGYMDTLWSCMEDRANYVDQTLQEMRDLPVYYEKLAYAFEQEEMKPYHTSLAANTVCKNTIEQVIAANYNDHRLDTSLAFAQLNAMFGAARLNFVLATTIRAKPEDGRISPENKRWAQTVPVPMDERSREYVVDRTHPGLLNLLVNQARTEWAQERAAKKKPSVREALNVKSQPRRKPKERTAVNAAPHRADSAR